MHKFGPSQIHTCLTNFHILVWLAGNDTLGLQLFNSTEDGKVNEDIHGITGLLNAIAIGCSGRSSTSVSESEIAIKNWANNSPIWATVQELANAVVSGMYLLFLLFFIRFTINLYIEENGGGSGTRLGHHKRDRRVEVELVTRDWHRGDCLLSLLCFSCTFSSCFVRYMECGDLNCRTYVQSSMSITDRQTDRGDRVRRK
ncbi:unnamed protein product [Trichobilharzia regenti]|nr:unnamed protein product [Trichobilharzia regenti]